jgi:DNA-binding Lrp family transcriptional regulator
MEGQGLATREIAAIIGLSARATRTRLARLIDRGLVREIGTSAKDPQRKYFLAEGGHRDVVLLGAWDWPEHRRLE